MRNYLIAMLAVLLTICTISGQVIQENANEQTQALYDYHMLQHKKAKTTGWVMLGVGIGMTIAGIGINASQGILDNDSTNNNQGLWLSYLGAATAIASIPSFISAGKNKRKANLFLKKSVATINLPKSRNPNYLSVSLIIPF